MKKSKEYASKIVEVAYHEVLPNKETVPKIVDALITEYAEQQIKELQSLLDLSNLQLKSSKQDVKELKDEIEKTKQWNLELVYANKFMSIDSHK
jgi:hypothetical protein